MSPLVQLTAYTTCSTPRFPFSYAAMNSGRLCLSAATCRRLGAGDAGKRSWIRNLTFFAPPPCKREVLTLVRIYNPAKLVRR